MSNVAEIIELFTYRDYLIGLPYHPFSVKLLLAKKQFSFRTKYALNTSASPRLVHIKVAPAEHLTPAA